MDTGRHHKTKLPRMSKPHYEPKVGDTITVELPDERTRATVEKVISDTAVIARLQHYMTSKSHNYKKDELIACRFETLSMGINGWRVMSERELDAAEQPRKKRKA